MSESLKNDVLKAIQSDVSNILVKTDKPLKLKSPKDIHDNTTNQLNAFKYLMDETEYVHNVININSPSTTTYKKRRHKVNEKIQQEIIIHAESYLNSADFYII